MVFGIIFFPLSRHFFIISVLEKSFIIHKEAIDDHDIEALASPEVSNQDELKNTNNKKIKLSK